MHCGLLRFELSKKGWTKSSCEHDGIGESCAGVAICSAPG
jgi:hypothetical protein